ncbi:hypothetical protein DFQ26_000567 [Actinomortierella ambigua]|nr:hypothetical protein DFQ26_000567 [Actinomortierella ambigua]
MLFDSTIITVVTGETGLSASRVERESSEKDHNGAKPPLSPKKADFVLKASVKHLRKLMHIELVGFKHKSRPAASEEGAAFG